jgi:HNH endonuclease
MFGGKVLNLAKPGWKTRYPKDWKQQSLLARQATGMRCSNVNCSKVINRANPLQTHHCIALGKNGKNIGANYMPLCKACHERREGRKPQLPKRKFKR